MLKIPPTHKVFLDNDLNGDVGKGRSAYVRVYRGHDFGDRTSMGKTVLNFA